MDQSLAAELHQRHSKNTNKEFWLISQKVLNIIMYDKLWDLESKMELSTGTLRIHGELHLEKMDLSELLEESTMLVSKAAALGLFLLILGVVEKRLL